jgi:hypothetical protein
MNMNTGGTHILFFERDTSLMALLTSEFQLAGYECHTARTAVEVFDAIARHPVKIVLVDLAQAAASRREFWVALDTQRRGRGVQVFTYQCYNLAGYGPKETEERSQQAVADMEIDGMYGLMNLVERIRERVPASPMTTTNTMPRLPRVAPPSTVAAPLSPMSAGVESLAQPEKMRTAFYSNQPVNVQQQFPSYTSQTQDGRVTQNMPSLPPVSPVTSPEQQRAYADGAYRRPGSADGTALQRLANGHGAGETRESGLAQLSRMIQENRPAITGDGSSRFPQPNHGMINSQVLRASPIEDLPSERGMTSDTSRRADGGTRIFHETSGRGGQRGQHSNYGTYQEASTDTPLASIASPLPTTYTAQPSQSLPVTEPVYPARPTVPIPAVTAQIPAVSRTNGAYVQPQGVQNVPQDTAMVREQPQPVEEQGQALSQLQSGPVYSTAAQYPVETQLGVERRQRTSDVQQVSSHEVQDVVREPEAMPPSPQLAMSREEVRQAQQPVEYSPSPQELYQRVRQHSEEEGRKEQRESDKMTPQEIALADIIQNLPASSSSTQPPVISGRTMRSLGSVLIEGHLVPQNRLEVAQNVQRMLRGVDLRYELGEILLMFKLLTPDQLLAASLVSYGLISTQQISALGRIRQELHSIGLEYDLESLIVLFRMLTPEQLREVRSSWQG